jgi:hypothetical protein
MDWLNSHPWILESLYSPTQMVRHVGPGIRVFLPPGPLPKELEDRLPTSFED